MQTISIELEQQTPLLHFQPMQEGATLRASEIKPRLDKYILETLGDGDKNEALAIARSKNWLIGQSEHEALNYKLRVIAYNPISLQMKVDKNTTKPRDENNRELFTTSNYPNNENSLIMGNIGGHTKEELLNFSFYKNIRIEIRSCYDDLISELTKYIPLFFIENNIGNRQSKGFGSFIVKSINNEKYTNKPQYDYFVGFTLNSEGETISEKEAYKDIFIIINRIWKGLKEMSGLSKPTRKLLTSVFLNTKNQLTANEERIPSPLLFKPRILSKSEEKWDVVLWINLRPNIIEAAKAKIDDLYDKLDEIRDKVKNYRDKDAFLPKTTYTINDIKIK